MSTEPMTPSALSPAAVVTEEQLRELRDRQFTRVLNTPRPTIEELEKILQRDDVRVEIQPNGEVRAVDDADRDLIVAICDELLLLRSTGAGVSREWVEPRERRPYNWAYPYAFLEALEDTMLGEDYAPTLEGIELVLLGYEELIGRGIPLPLAPTTPKDEK